MALTNQIEKYCSRLQIDNLSCAIVKNNDALFSNACKDILINELSLFQIGSITKLFTATAIMIAVDNNLISLDDKLKEMFNLNSPHTTGDITIYELLTHTSGLPGLPATFFELMKSNESDPYSVLTNDMLFDYLENNRELSAKSYLYSNLGYGILGKILERIYGMDYEAVITKNICRPLSMNDTCINYKSKNLAPVKGLNYKNVNTGYWTDEVLTGAGMLFSTTTDLAKFIKSHFQGGLLHELGNKMFVQQNKHMGYGWHSYMSLIDRIFFNSYRWHNGMVGGFSSYISLSIKQKKGFVMLCNKQVSLSNLIYTIRGYL
jgi:CubicO group peptidase (beta-lactamase class C family)